jgi:hypothetical protein
MRASAQVTAPGAVTSRVVAMSTRPNRQNRSTCSRMSVPSQQKQKLTRCHVLGSSTRILEANREKWGNDFTLRMIIILMETIKDPYYQPRVSTPFFCKPHALGWRRDVLGPSRIVSSFHTSSPGAFFVSPVLVGLACDLRDRGECVHKRALGCAACCVSYARPL